MAREMIEAVRRAEKEADETLAGAVGGPGKSSRLPDPRQRNGERPPQKLRRRGF